MSKEEECFSIFPSQREEWPCVLCSLLQISHSYCLIVDSIQLAPSDVRAAALFNQVIISQWLSHFQKTHSFRSLHYTTLFKTVDFCMVLICSTLRSYSHFRHRDHGTHNSLPPKLVQIPSWGQDSLVLITPFIWCPVHLLFSHALPLITQTGLNPEWP